MNNSKEIQVLTKQLRECTRTEEALIAELMKIAGKSVYCEHDKHCEQYEEGIHTAATLIPELLAGCRSGKEINIVANLAASFLQKSEALKAIDLYRKLEKKAQLKALIRSL